MALGNYWAIALRGQCVTLGAGVFVPAGGSWPEYIRANAGKGTVRTNNRHACKLAAIVAGNGGRNVRIQVENKKRDTWRVVWEV
jgi:hypothetical protein